MSTATRSKAPLRTYPHDAVCADCGKDFRYYSRPSERLERYEIPTHCDHCGFVRVQAGIDARDGTLAHITDAQIAPALELLRDAYRVARAAGDQAGMRAIASKAATLKARQATPAPAPAPADELVSLIDYERPPARLDNVAYTVVYGTGERDYLTVKVKPHWDDAKAAAGEQVLAYHTTTGERPYESAAFIAGGALRLYRHYRGTELGRLLERCYAILTTSADLMLSARTEYATRTKRCACCNRELKVPASLHAGLGPECRKKVAAS